MGPISPGSVPPGSLLNPMPTLTVDGRERSYLLDVPKNPQGLVLVCHGFGGSAEDMRGWAGFSKVLDSHSFVFAYPDGLPDAKGKRNFQVEYQFQDPKINDVTFVQQLVAHLVKQYKLDPKRVFCTGMSNGADFSYYLARQPKPLVCAIAPIAGCMMVGWDKTLTARNRIPIMEVHGTKDTVTLWDGDLQNRDGWGAYLGTEAVAAHWEKSLTLIERESKTSDKLTRTRWWTKRDTTEFVLYTIDGGGHDWPAHLEDPKRSLAEEILQFFEKHSKK